METSRCWGFPIVRVQESVPAFHSHILQCFRLLVNSQLRIEEYSMVVILSPIIADESGDLENRLPQWSIVVSGMFRQDSCLSVCFLLFRRRQKTQVQVCLMHCDRQFFCNFSISQLFEDLKNFCSFGPTFISVRQNMPNINISTGCTKKMSWCLALYCARMKKNKGFKSFVSFRGRFNLNFGISYFHFG